MAFAQITNGVVSAIEQGTGPNLVACGSAVQVGWAYTNGVFTPPATQAQTAAQIAEQSAGALLAQGINIESTSNPSLNAVYSLSTASQSYINGIISCVLTSGAFFNNASSQIFYDAMGNPHTFTVPQFKAFALAVGAFVDAITLYALSGGTQGSLPQNPVTIA